jgi:hypothetical protein
LACSVSDPDSDFKDAASLVLEELGENMHIALHSRASELQYQRQLVESLLPLLLPSSALGSRYVCVHIFEQNNIHAGFFSGFSLGSVFAEKIEFS